MRLNRTVTALAVTVALSAGTVAGAAPVFASEAAPVANVRIDTDEELQVERSLDKLYAAIDEAARSGAEGTYDEAQRLAVDKAVMELIAATKKVDAPAEAQAKPAKEQAPEPPVPGDAPKKLDKEAALADAKKKLEAEVKVILDAAAKGDLVKLGASVEVATKVVVELLVTVGLGPLLGQLGLGNVTALLPGLTDALLKPGTPPAGLPTGGLPQLPLPLPLPVPGLPTGGLPTGLPTGGLPLPLPMPFGK
ncbi:hypothetical protein H9Y04_02815 [Streptomyces sp. TRM66268-LWL]|uniref:Secreted protein n=1 Tax=Streptomyces polyasparticus TaxID=2767826 RepID=A0ABR7S9E2_9ACTN|nr:hypothetical protein [Streptomyces polyasparticus]MBC9711504.1 hypothetical protein [Streptomyces polyasparticus]